MGVMEIAGLSVPTVSLPAVAVVMLSLVHVAAALGGAAEGPGIALGEGRLDVTVRSGAVEHARGLRRDDRDVRDAAALVDRHQRDARPLGFRWMAELDRLVVEQNLAAGRLGASAEEGFEIVRRRLFEQTRARLED